MDEIGAVRVTRVGWDRGREKWWSEGGLREHWWDGGRGQGDGYLRMRKVLYLSDG